MRLILMGTGPFAVPTFQSLLESPHEVALLVTRPDRPAHRKPTATANPARELAERHKLPVIEPDSINSSEAEAELTRAGAKLFIVCDYGQILSAATLGLARLGGINLHASLLPKYRGAAPINWAIYQGECETGVSVIHMTPQLDAGPCLVQKRVAIDPNETAVELEARLAVIGVSAVHEAISILEGERQAAAMPQDAAAATRARRLKKTDGLVDWNRPAAAIRNQVRALQPWPKTYTFWLREGHPPLRLILEDVAVADSPLAGPPGQIVEAGGDVLVVACGSGGLQIKKLQPAGKRLMTTGEFLRGHPVESGQRLA